MMAAQFSEDDLREAVKTLWLQGLTGRQISEKLRITRNAVLGKVHRMRETGKIGIRECDMRMRSIREETKRREKIRNAELSDILRESPYEKEEVQPKKSELEVVRPLIIHVEPEPEPERPRGKPITFDQLKYNSCRFIVNDGPAKDFLFCGEVKKGKSYCEEHENVCYHRPLGKK